MVGRPGMLPFLCGGSPSAQQTCEKVNKSSKSTPLLTRENRDYIDSDTIVWISSEFRACARDTAEHYPNRNRFPARHPNTKAFFYRCCAADMFSASAQAPIFYFPGGKTTMQKIIELHNIIKEFDGERILDNIDLDIYDKEFITILGPSGCGKTTTLRIIGGFETPDSGEFLFDGKRINDIPAYRRNVNTVFQKYALFPHLNVFENIAFALRLKKVPEDEIIRRVREMLDMVALRGFEHKNVNYLSGGQGHAERTQKYPAAHRHYVYLRHP